MSGAQEALERFDLGGATVASASWTEGMRDFRVSLADGRRLTFRDCLQAGFHRSLNPNEPLTIGGWWSDEPSPLLTSLGPEIRFLFEHLVFEVGEGLLRIACRSVDVSDPDGATGS